MYISDKDEFLLYSEVFVFLDEEIIFVKDGKEYPIETYVAGKFKYLRHLINKKLEKIVPKLHLHEG